MFILYLWHTIMMTEGKGPVTQQPGLSFCGLELSPNPSVWWGSSKPYKMHGAVMAENKGNNCSFMLCQNLLSQRNGSGSHLHQFVFVDMALG